MPEEEEIEEHKGPLPNMDDQEDIGESNYFSEPKFESVIARYYTRLYKRVTPALISQMLEKKEEDLSEEQKREKETTCLDQYYFVHTNKLVLFGLSERHEAIANNASNPIISVSFDSGKKHRSHKQVSGKSKSKNYSF